MPEASRKLYLIDAMSNIHRAYHAIQRLSTSAGRPTNAVYGFVTMLRKMLREHGPDYVVVATADKDMLQLVRPGVRVFHTGREVFLDDSGVVDFFGVTPGQVADVLALMGDSVDNIPGVPGVG